jgi:tRNA (guanine-N7-)-methyltransferase
VIQTPRAAELGELLPEDYFRRLVPTELFTGCSPLEVDLGCGDGTKAKLENLRVLRLEARYTVEWLLPHASVSRLHLLFPDPWPKAKHHRRRLVQQEFLSALDTTLVPGGEFLFKTDHEEYFEWAKVELALFGRFLPLDWPEDAFFYPQTDFERQWRAEGRTVFHLRMQKPASA